MNITERLRLEVLIRDQINKHGDMFYIELAKILQKVQNETRPVDPRTREVIYK